MVCLSMQEKVNNPISFLITLYLAEHQSGKKFREGQQND